MATRLTPKMRNNRASTAAAIRLPNNRFRMAANEAPSVGWQQVICEKGHACTVQLFAQPESQTHAIVTVAMTVFMNNKI